MNANRETEQPISFRSQLPALLHGEDFKIDTVFDADRKPLTVRWLTPEGSEKIESARDMLFAPEKPRYTIPLQDPQMAVSLLPGTIIRLDEMLATTIIRMRFGKNICDFEGLSQRKHTFSDAVILGRYQESDRKTVRYKVLLNGWLPEFLEHQYLYPPEEVTPVFRMVREPISIGHEFDISSTVLLTAQSPQSMLPFLKNLAQRLMKK